MSASDEKKAMELTEQDNKFIDKFRGKVDTKQEDVEREVRRSGFYAESTDEEIENATKRIFEKRDFLRK